MKPNRTHLLTSPTMFKVLAKYSQKTFRIYKYRFKNKLKYPQLKRQGPKPGDNNRRTLDKKVNQKLPRQPNTNPIPSSSPSPSPPPPPSPLPNPTVITTNTTTSRITPTPTLLHPPLTLNGILLFSLCILFLSFFFFCLSFPFKERAISSQKGRDHSA